MSTSSISRNKPASEPAVIYEDNHLIGVFKPSSMLVQADRTGDKALNDWTKGYIKKVKNKPGEVYLGTLHRLDRPVSGLVLFAKTSKAAERMSRLFKEGLIQKEYLAICSGRPERPEATLIHYLSKDGQTNIVTAYRREMPATKKSILDYRTIAVKDGLSLLQVSPKTGRSHQIRVQLSEIGHPILGDVKYGSSFKTRDRSLYLYCKSMSFIHPVRKESIKISVPTPKDTAWSDFTSILENPLI